jgi:hypothetical protein
MKKGLLTVFALLALATLACGFNLNSAKIANAQMARDSEATAPTTVFGQDEPFYCVVELADAPDDTKVKAIWTAVEIEGSDPNTLIDEVEVTSGSDTLHFDLTNDKLWPVGKYKVELFLNDKLDRTLEFEVEGEVAAATPEAEPTSEATATPEPTATSEPEPSPTPTDEPEPTPTGVAKSSISDSLAGIASGDNTPTPETDEPPTALPLQPEPYTHPSGAFSFAIPEDWNVIEEKETHATVGDAQSIVGVEFVDASSVYTKEVMDRFIELYLESFIPVKKYEILTQRTQGDGRTYVSVAFTSRTGDEAKADFFFEQRGTIVFVFYFSTFAYERLLPTWGEIISSYKVDPKAAQAAAPAPATKTTATPQPKPTPAPAANPFAPQSGRSRLYVFNEIGETLTFTINNKEYKIPPGGIDKPIPIDLDPGRYTYTISIPFAAVNGEVTLGVNQSWAVGVRSDKAVYDPFQVYP